ncbi:MAG TPA: hypothetical protein VGE07_08200 [Herpetosiphonaceae bacterium]
MKKQWRTMLLAAGSAVSSMIVAALLRERKQESHAEAEPAAERRGAAQAAAGPVTKRDMAINFLSDLLAETYRKIRSQQDRRP